VRQSKGLNRKIKFLPFNISTFAKLIWQKYVSIYKKKKKKKFKIILKKKKKKKNKEKKIKNLYHIKLLYLFIKKEINNKMHNRNLFYLVCIFALLFTSIYGLTKNEVSKFKCDDISYGDNGYYCKDDICVSTSGRNDLATIVIPNKGGQNITYITDTCSSNDIDLDLCSSKECTADSQCLSNKCVKGHCSFNEANPIVHCQCTRTVHNNPIFGDPKGYKMICGLPKGDKCNSNSDCSSYNCYEVCGDPDSSGCHSACGIGRAIVLIIAVPVIIGILIIICCVCCICIYKKNKKKETNNV